jgi:hypothetical protein
MDGALLIVVMLVSAAAVGVWLWAVWRSMFATCISRLPSARRAGIVHIVGIAPIALAALFELSNRQAFLVLALVTFVAVGIGIGDPRRHAHLRSVALHGSGCGSRRVRFAG